MYNNDYIKNLFITDKLVIKLLKSYFNSFNKKLEKKVDNTRIQVRFRRLSINKIFISNPEFKHTTNEVYITLYVYNRQKQYFINKIKKINSVTYLSIKNFKYIIAKIKLQGLNIINQIKIEENLIPQLKKQQLIKVITISKNKYYTFIKKLLGKEILIIYYKHLLYLNKSKFQGSYLNKIAYLLKEKIYNKNVRFNIVNLKYIALNSDIFTESISLKLKKRNNSLLRVLNRSLNSVILPSVNKASEDYSSIKNKDINKYININNKQTNTDVLDKILVNSLLLNNNNEKVNKLVESSILTSIKYKTINGLRLEAKGRLSKRLIAAKSVFKFRYKGSLKNINSSYKQLSCVMIRGNMKSNLQYTYLGSKTRNGSFGLKGWISSK